MLVGGKEFTLIGRPLLHRDQVKVTATVVEKTLEYPKAVMFHRPREHRNSRLNCKYFASVYIYNVLFEHWVFYGGIQGKVT